MPMRFPPVLLPVGAAVGAILAIPLGAADASASTVAMLWEGGAESPGVCVEKGHWFATVIPEGVALEDLKTVRARTGSGERTGRLLHLDPDDRLCLVEVASIGTPSQPVPLSACLNPKAGDKAECLSGASACRTTVAGKDWSYRGERFALPLLRLRVSHRGPHCKAGTPLLCEEGSLIGILTDHALESGDEVHAVPAARVRKLVEDVKRHNRSGPVWIGLLFHDESCTPEVVEVKSGSPAAKAGVKEGDVILAVGGNDVESLDDLVESIHILPAGETVAVKVLRGLEEQSLSIVPQFAEVAAAR